MTKVIQEKAGKLYDRLDIGDYHQPDEKTTYVDKTFMELDANERKANPQVHHKISKMNNNTQLYSLNINTLT
jgi:tellurite resistance-related uncharacterized protein